MFSGDTTDESDMRWLSEQHTPVQGVVSGCISLAVHSGGTRNVEGGRRRAHSQLTVTTPHVVTVNCNIPFPRLQRTGYCRVLKRRMVWPNPSGHRRCQVSLWLGPGTVRPVWGALHPGVFKGDLKWLILQSHHIFRRNWMLVSRGQMEQKSLQPELSNDASITNDYC